jgi:peptide/nickel transport system ATP-binding protein
MSLEAKNLSFAYKGSRQILSDYSLELQQGEFVALIGPSGGGKSTLAKLLAGIEKPKSGAVLFDDQPLPKRGYRPVQLVYQHPELAMNPRWKLGKSLTEGWEPDAELLTSLGIEQAWLNRWPNELSGGELQRFCLARALGPQTKFLIADEMTTMLDAITQAQIWDAIQARAKQHNMGVLVITHNRHLGERLSDRLIEF